MKTQPAIWDPARYPTAPDVVADPAMLAEARLALLGLRPARLSVPVDEQTRAAAQRAGWLVLRDSEGVPVAAVAVVKSRRRRVILGDAVGTEAATMRFGDLRQLRASLRLNQPIAVVGHDPPDSTVMQVVYDQPERPVILVVLDGPRRSPGPEPANVVVAARQISATLRAEGRTAEVVVLPAPEYGDDRDASLAERIGQAFGAARIVPARTEDRRGLLDALDTGAPIPIGMPKESWDAWRRWRPPPDRRGLVVLFTGLSGSGKSTVATAVAAAIVEEGVRSVSLLDGDVVRRLLSSGLGFSRSDRDLNVLRIGFVASEIARHGGVAICAPIAPFAATRQRVREMVSSHGDFVLVHVATPLAECERRDRKGLYARARTGEIPDFTGISSPYEPPDDANLVIDTTAMSVESAAGAVIKYLRQGGWLGSIFAIKGESR